MSNISSQPTSTPVSVYFEENNGNFHQSIFAVNTSQKKQRPRSWYGESVTTSNTNGHDHAGNPTINKYNLSRSNTTKNTTKNIKVDKAHVVSRPLMRRSTSFNNFNQPASTGRAVVNRRSRSNTVGSHRRVTYNQQVDVSLQNSSINLGGFSGRSSPDTLSVLSSDTSFRSDSNLNRMSSCFSISSFQDAKSNQTVISVNTNHEQLKALSSLSLNGTDNGDDVDDKNNSDELSEIKNNDMDNNNYKKKNKNNNNKKQVNSVDDKGSANLVKRKSFRSIASKWKRHDSKNKGESKSKADLNNNSKVTVTQQSKSHPQVSAPNSSCSLPSTKPKVAIVKSLPMTFPVPEVCVSSDEGIPSERSNLKDATIEILSANENAQLEGCSDNEILSPKSVKKECLTISDDSFTPKDSTESEIAEPIVLIETPPTVTSLISTESVEKAIACSSTTPPTLPRLSESDDPVLTVNKTETLSAPVVEDAIEDTIIFNADISSPTILPRKPALKKFNSEMELRSKLKTSSTMMPENSSFQTGVRSKTMTNLSTFNNLQPSATAVASMGTVKRKKSRKHFHHHHKKLDNLDAKIALVGTNDVGKTALVHRLMYHAFEEDYKATTEDHHVKLLQIDDTKVHTRILDCAHTQFDFDKSNLRDVDILVFVYSVVNLDSFNYLKNMNPNYLIPFMERKPTIVLIGSKLDLSDEQEGDGRQVSSFSGEKLAKELGALFFEVSATNQRSTKPFYEALRHHVREVEYNLNNGIISSRSSSSLKSNFTGTDVISGSTLNSPTDIEGETQSLCFSQCSSSSGGTSSGTSGISNTSSRSLSGDVKSKGFSFYDALHINTKKTTKPASKLFKPNIIQPHSPNIATADQLCRNLDATHYRLQCAFNEN